MEYGRSIVMRGAQQMGRPLLLYACICIKSPDNFPKEEGWVLARPLQLAMLLPAHSLP